MSGLKIKTSHKAIQEGRTVFVNSIKSSKDFKILQLAKRNSKLGNGKYIIKKGSWKGMPLFSITLEERKTCPKSCHHWGDCFGNNMFLASRISHKTSFKRNLEREVNDVSKRYPNGFVIRLHVLGDFYSVAYVQLWALLLKQHKNLRIFGYTARTSGAIAETLDELRKSFPNRFLLRESSNNSYSPKRKTKSFAANENFTGDGIICPHSEKKTDSCLTCGLCLNGNFKKTIIFPTH